jgi:antitoxin FitA
VGDMLVRGIDPELKRRLEDRAHRNGRSLSEEAIALLRKAIATQETGIGRAGDRLRAAVGSASFTSEELTAIEELRKDPDRNPPDMN